MRLAEGMNHARSSHSSERPAEHDEIERSIRVGEVLGPPNMEADTPGEALEPPAGGADPRRVGIDATHDSPEAGEPQRQAPIASADLLNAPTSPLGDSLERAHLSLLRVDA
jgi:hypothetical protein